MAESFPEIRFKGKLRPSQTDVVKIAQEQLAAGKRSLHIVAPPGSGKTVLGLYLWSRCVRCPALVLSPNSAIQAQWAARTDLFDLGLPRHEVVSTRAQEPALLTSLTYQAVTMPGRGDSDLEATAIQRWIDTLIEKDQAQDPDEAKVWIEDLLRHNPDYYERRLSAYRKQARDAITLTGDALATLHASALATLDRLRSANVGMIILDECHHLMGHWGRVLADAHDFFDGPVVVGLTATPPDREGRLPEDIARYDAFFGPVDFEVPVPAVVKDGYLAPYQDLAYFVRPTTEELSFIAAADQRLKELVDLLCSPQDSGPSPPESVPRDMVTWLLDVLTHRRLPTGSVRNWANFQRRDPALADAARWFLIGRGIPLPRGVPAPYSTGDASDKSTIEMVVPVIDRYVRHHLLRSPRPSDHELAQQAIARLRTLGVQITETGTRACASPVGRVLAYSHNKIAALVPILRAEQQVLGDRMRAVVVTDFEKTSAITAEISHLLDEEAGGAIAAFRALVRDASTDTLDPVLVTGSSVLVDDDLAERFLATAEDWLGKAGMDVKLALSIEDGFREVVGQGSDWCPRVYVEMITALFQRGVTRCLVGTRGLLGEGWDAHKVNVLIDLTTATTSMTVNQLRGRSIRLDPDEPVKIANNWDVVCVAPEFSKGLEDYQRFIKKHKTVFGMTDDGVIEKGVGHVHAAFTALKPEGLEQSVAVLNADMLGRPATRQAFRDLWRIGEPYHPEPLQAVEARLAVADATFPPFRGMDTAWSDKSLAIAVARAVLGALGEAGLVKGDGTLHAGERAGGYVRMFLSDADPHDRELFGKSLRQALGPLRRPRYVVPRHVDRISETFLSRILPKIVGRYFQRRKRSLVMMHAVPSILGKNKQRVAVYQQHWNRHVSPGEAVFARRGRGEVLVEQARRKGLVPHATVHDKEIFL